MQQSTSKRTLLYEWHLSAACLLVELDGVELDSFNQWRALHVTGSDLNWPGFEAILGRRPGSMPALVQPIGRLA